MSPPTLECREARIDREGGGPLIEQLSAVADGRKLVLQGAFVPLLALCAGRAHVVSGSVRILGIDAAAAVRRGRVGLALADLAFATDWSAERLLSQSAELIGHGAAEARRLARTTLAELGLGELKKRRLAHLDSTSRRAVSIAHAAMTRPDALVVESPLAGLDDARSELVLSVLERATRSAALLVITELAGPTAPERALIAQADAVLTATRDGVVLVGEPGAREAAHARYLLTVLRNVEALEAALGDRGLRTRRYGTDERPRLVVTLDAATTEPLVAAAVAADAPLIEMIPLAWGSEPA